jgi:hypothetical protein
MLSAMDEDADDGIKVTGNDPLVNGMNISVRMRLDFVVTDAERFLAAARRAYRAVYPDTDDEQAAQAVTCAADAIFTVLEHARVLPASPDEQLATYDLDGLERGGWRAQAIFNDPWPLHKGGCGFGAAPDPFALPEHEIDR